MSTLATGHYEHQAARFGVPVPPILDGQPRLLTNEGDEVFIHNPQSTLGLAAEDSIAKHLKSTHDFVLAGVPQENQDTIDPDKDFGQKNKLFLEGCLTRLLIPERINVGRLSNIVLQAITASEVEPATLAYIKSGKNLRTNKRDYPVDIEAESNAYLELSCLLTTGRKKHDLGSFVLVHAVDYNSAYPRAKIANNITFTHYVGTPSEANREVAKDLRHQRKGAAMGNSSAADNASRQP